MVKYAEQEVRTLTDWFPSLKTDSNFQITSDCTPAYNCIGWALGMNDVWVGLDHPINYSWTWWPEEVPCDEQNESLIALFEYFGFTKCDESDYEKDFDKVALYGNNEGWTHAARIVEENIFHSKIGTAWDIHHSGGDIFENTEYGRIYAYMKRPLSERYMSEMKKPKIGTVIVNWM